jgi:hypothetical protein
MLTSALKGFIGRKRIFKGIPQKTKVQIYTSGTDVLNIVTDVKAALSGNMAREQLVFMPFVANRKEAFRLEKYHQYKLSKEIWQGQPCYLPGTLACLAGVGLSVAGAWALSRFAFHIPFQTDWWPLGLTFLSITVLTVLIGLFNSREVVRKPPLEVLRAEL